MGYQSFYNKYIKRWLGFFLSLVLFLIIWPVYLIIALAILIEDGSPVFYRPKRGGYHNRPFRIFKFRSMIKNADKVGGGTTALNDPRITRVGNFLRKTKLDETPQLFNIIGGSMSFIGPRPELLRYTDQYEGEEKLIFEVRPGITDYSSIEFINLDEIVGQGNADEMYEKYVLKKKNALRIKYAKEVSFVTDVKLFSRTVWGVIMKAMSFIFLGKHK
jgi:lipopolysaccharide/colanic/teichoic acid biosynthesis glycosyltransferase